MSKAFENGDSLVIEGFVARLKEETGGVSYLSEHIAESLPQDQTVHLKVINTLERLGIYKGILGESIACNLVRSATEQKNIDSLKAIFEIAELSGIELQPLIASAVEAALRFSAESVIQFLKESYPSALNDINIQNLLNHRLSEDLEHENTASVMMLIKNFSFERVKSFLLEFYAYTIQGDDMYREICQSRLLYSHGIEILQIFKDAIKNRVRVDIEYLVEIMNISGFDEELAKEKFDKLLDIALKNGFKNLVHDMISHATMDSKPISGILTDSLISTVEEDQSAEFANVVRSLSVQFRPLVGRALGIKLRESISEMYAYLRRKYILPKMLQYFNIGRKYILPNMLQYFNTLSKPNLTANAKVVENEECSICLNTFDHGELEGELSKNLRDEVQKAIQTPCYHRFHVDCLISVVGAFEYSDFSVECLVCRAILSPPFEE